MGPTDEKHQGTCQDTVLPEQSPNLTINHLPDEVLLEIFDSYRQGTKRSTYPYDLQWRKKHVWLILTLVCRRWRAVMFASSSRLDLGITLGPETPGHIETILSSPLPIFIEYYCCYEETIGSSLWRMHAALKHHDRVRKITFEGTGTWFDEFLKATNCTFPVLENLVLRPVCGHEPKLPETFLGGPDLSYLRLRRITLCNISFSCISGFLLSTTALTDLTLQIDTVFGPSPEKSLLVCLQGMPCLRSLDLSTFSDPESPSQSSTHKNIVPLFKLTRFRYDGHSVLLDALVAGISAPSLWSVYIDFFNATLPPIVHLPRFIHEIEEHYHVAHVTFVGRIFLLSLLTQSEYIGHCEPRFNLGTTMWDSPESPMRMSSALCTRLTAVEELCVAISETAADNQESLNLFPWRRFYRQFPRVKVLRERRGNDYCIARTLHQDPGEPGDLTYLPALEEIDLGKSSLTIESERASKLAAFLPFVSARQHVGRPVKVSFSP